MRPRIQATDPFSTRRDRPTTLLPWAAGAVFALAALSACSGDGAPPELLGEAEIAASCAQPVGLALEIDGGVGAPLQVRAGQSFYLSQIDLRASLLTAVDEGVDGLKSNGDFAGLSWGGIALVDQEMVAAPNPDGTFTRRRYYRDAKWMNGKSSFTLQQLDAQGHVVGETVTVQVGKDGAQKPKDDFFIRRLRAIQWTHDCAAPTSCSGASHFEEEALVELRGADGAGPALTIAASTTALRLRWSLQPGPGYVIPLQQIAAPQYAYGFSIDLAVLTPPGASGVYAPGSDLTVQATLRDGAGHRLHAPGVLPSYLEVAAGLDPAGIQYYRGFVDPAITYYRRKHRERQMLAQLIGPVQKLEPIRTVVDVGQILGPDEVLHVGLPARDGVYGDVVGFPRLNKLLGGAFDPTHAAWAEPVSDTWTHHIPTDAQPGTYLLTMKARRVYLGEDVPFTRTITIQVGSPTPTTPKPKVGHCGNCHEDAGALDKVLHGNDDLAACNGCHAPLALELDNPVYVRAHFIHSRSGRYDAPLQACSTCHLTSAGIQRTSKSACLSCHTSYPPSHVAQFGPITSALTGGGPESFAQCSTTCHTTHPGSKLP